MSTFIGQCIAAIIVQNIDKRTCLKIQGQNPNLAGWVFVNKVYVHGTYVANSCSFEEGVEEFLKQPLVTYHKTWMQNHG